MRAIKAERIILNASGIRRYKINPTILESKLLKAAFITSEIPKFSNTVEATEKPSFAKKILDFKTHIKYHPAISANKSLKNKYIPESAKVKNSSNLSNKETFETIGSENALDENKNKKLIKKYTKIAFANVP